MATNPYIDRIMDRVRIRVPGTLDGVTQIELFDAVNEFLANTNAWQDTIEVELKPGKFVYDLTPSGGSAETWRIMSVKNVDGTPYRLPAWMTIPGELQTSSDVTEKTKIMVTVALAPGLMGKKQTYPDIPDYIWNDYYDIILDGVISRLMSQPAKPYSNPQMALFHGKKFNSGCNVAKWQLENGRLYRGQNWRFPQTFAGRNLRRP